MVCGDLFRARDQKVYRGLVLARDPALAVVYRLLDPASDQLLV